jgi:hypothetical protein
MIYDDFATALHSFRDGVKAFDQELAGVEATLRTLAGSPAGVDELRRLLATIVPMLEAQEQNFAELRTRFREGLDWLGGAPGGRG